MRANDVNNGMAIKLNGKLYMVIKTEHTKPGKGPAYIQMKLKEVGSGSNIDKRFGSTADVEIATLDRRQMEYLYTDSSGHVFMDSESFDQVALSEDLIGDRKDYFAPNLPIIVHMSEGLPVMIELPASVELAVTETPPGIKGATATNQLKEATLETGLKTRVPPFIEPGETVRISTADGSYQSRA